MILSNSSVDALLTRQQLEQLRCHSRLIVAYSGGLDSTVLLHAVAVALGQSMPILALHINHQLSPYAASWEQHCRRFCEQLRGLFPTDSTADVDFLPLKLDYLSLTVQISQENDLENSARKARYAAFAQVVEPGDALLLAQHGDDQVETFFLQLFRGAGIDGLAAMPAMASFGRGQLVRPLLERTQEQLNAYARQHDLAYVEDESNHNLRFSRNYVRHQILPIIKKRWPSVAQNIMRTVSHCQQAQHNLRNLAQMDVAAGREGCQRQTNADGENLDKTACPSFNKTVNSHSQTAQAGETAGSIGSAGNPYPFNTGRAVTVTPQLPLADLEPLTYARKVNYLRYWLQQHNVPCPSNQTLSRVFSELLAARQDANPEVAWGSCCLRRYRNSVYLCQPQREQPLVGRVWDDFPSPLLLGECEGYFITVQNPPHYLIKREITVTCRKGGESIRLNGKTRSLKKLMQQWNIPPWLRNTIPLIYADGTLLSVVGYANADALPEHCQFVLCT